MHSAFYHLVETLRRYSPLSDETIVQYLRCCRVKQLEKGQHLLELGQIPSHFAFLHKGLIRAYVMDEAGNEFNKNFFAEGRFPGSMTALLNNEPSFLAIQALEPVEVVEIDFSQFRALLETNSELMMFQIRYLEKHWLLEKESKEIGYLQYEAKQRYQDFLINYQSILPRLSQFHIASYLGITPTQLSRIKKPLSQHM